MFKYIKFIIPFIITLFISANLYAIGKVYFPEPKKVAEATSADFAKISGAVDMVKVNGIPSTIHLYESNSTDTNGFGFIGPVNATKNFLYRISDESPAIGQIFKIDSISADQTVTTSTGSMTADIVTLILEDSSFVSIPPAFRNSPGTSGQYAYSTDGLTRYDCVATNTWMTSTLVDSLLLPAGTMTLAIIGGGTISINGITYNSVGSPYTTTDLPASVSMTANCGTGGENFIVWSGPGMGDIIGNYPNFTMSSEGAKNIIATFGNDTTNPIVGSVTLSLTSHQGDSPAVVVTVASVIEEHEKVREYQIYDIIGNVVVEAYQPFTGLVINETVPAGSGQYRFDIRVTDAAGNTSMSSSSAITYFNPEVLVAWDAGDTLATQHMLNIYQEGGGSIDSVNVSFSSSGHDSTAHSASKWNSNSRISFQCTDGGNINYNKGTLEFSLNVTVDYDDYLFCAGEDLEFAVRYMVVNSTRVLRFYYNNVEIDYPVNGFGISDMLGGLFYFKLDWDNTAGSEVHDITLNGITQSGIFNVGTSLGVSPTIADKVMYLGSNYNSTYSVYGQIDNFKIYNTVQPKNQFNYTFSSPVYANATGPLAVTVTDIIAQYTTRKVEFRIDAGAYIPMTNTSGDVWSSSLTGLVPETVAAGSHNILFRATDTKLPAAVRLSDVYAGGLIVDLTNPVVTASGFSAHNGVDPVISSCTMVETYPSPTAITFTATGASPASGTCTLNTGAYLTPSLTPTGNVPIVITFTGHDRAGNTGTAIRTIYAQGPAVETLRPSSDYSVTKWAEFGDTDSYHWNNLIDSSDTTGISVDNPSSDCMFNCTNTSIASGRVINSVTVKVRMRNTLNLNGAYIRVYAGSTHYSYTVETLGAAYTEHSYVMTTNPATSLPWVSADIDNMRIGLMTHYSLNATEAAEMSVDVNFTVE